MKWSSLFLLIPILFWGGSYTALKLSLRELDPLEIIAARFLLAAPALYAVIKLKGLAVWPVAKRRKLVLASFLVFLHFWVMATGMKETTASNTAWILTTSPIFIALVAWLFLREPFRPGQWLGILLASLGVVALVANGDQANLSWIRSRGDLIVLGSCLTWALYTVATRDITAAVHPLVATFWMAFLAGLVFVPYVVIFRGTEVYTNIGAETILSLVFLGVFCLAAAFSMWAEGLVRRPAAEVGMYLYVEPLAAVVIAWLLLDETITVWLLVGAVLITLGLWVTQRSGRTHPPHVLPEKTPAAD